MEWFVLPTFDCCSLARPLDRIKITNISRTNTRQLLFAKWFRSFAAKLWKLESTNHWDLAWTDFMWDRRFPFREKRFEQVPNEHSNNRWAECFELMWFFRFPFWENLFEHVGFGHWKGFKPVCTDPMCVFRLPLRENLFEHDTFGHAKGFRPECAASMCSLSWLLYENFFEHVPFEHSNGFWMPCFESICRVRLASAERLSERFGPICTALMCRWMYRLLKNDFLHKWHSKVSWMPLAWHLVTRYIIASQLSNESLHFTSFGTMPLILVLELFCFLAKTSSTRFSAPPMLSLLPSSDSLSVKVTHISVGWVALVVAREWADFVPRYRSLVFTLLSGQSKSIRPSDGSANELFGPDVSGLLLRK